MRVVCNKKTKLPLKIANIKKSEVALAKETSSQLDQNLTVAICNNRGKNNLTDLSVTKQLKKLNDYMDADVGDCSKIGNSKLHRAS